MMNKFKNIETIDFYVKWIDENDVKYSGVHTSNINHCAIAVWLNDEFNEVRLSKSSTVNSADRLLNKMLNEYKTTYNNIEIKIIHQ